MHLLVVTILFHGGDGSLLGFTHSRVNLGFVRHQNGTQELRVQNLSTLHQSSASQRPRKIKYASLRRIQVDQKDGLEQKVEWDPVDDDVRKELERAQSGKDDPVGEPAEKSAS
jgi:hypothetical protein